MDEFMIQGENGFIRLSSDQIICDPILAKTKMWCEFEGYLEIKSDSFFVEKSNIGFTLDEIHQFYVELEKCFQELNGKVVFENYEHNLNIEIRFNQGHVKVKGTYQAGFVSENKLIFSIDSDQSYFVETLKQLRESFINKYFE